MSSQAVTSRRLNALILPVCLAGLGVLSAAAYVFATTEHTARALIGLAALTAAATLAERFPVPINAETGGGVTSLTFVFAVAAIVLFGWAAGALSCSPRPPSSSSPSTARYSASPSTSRCSRSSHSPRAL